jgi:gamma-glutamyl hercynylcysteine S-oxide synthase
LNSTAITQSYFDRLHARIREARSRSEELFEIVRPDALYDRPIPERHRIIFYLGHLEAFDWNLLLEPLGLAPFDPDFDRLFAFGIDPVEGGLPNDRPEDWPSLEKVRLYAARLRNSLDEALRAAATKDSGLAHLEHGRLLDVAIEHRLMHAETLC